MKPFNLLKRTFSTILVVLTIYCVNGLCGLTLPFSHCQAASMANTIMMVQSDATETEATIVAPLCKQASDNIVSCRASSNHSCCHKDSSNVKSEAAAKSDLKVSLLTKSQLAKLATLASVTDIKSTSIVASSTLSIGKITAQSCKLACTKSCCYPLKTLQLFNNSQTIQIPENGLSPLNSLGLLLPNRPSHNYYAISQVSYLDNRATTYLKCCVFLI